MRYALIIPVLLILFSCSSDNRFNTYSLSRIYTIETLDYKGQSLVPHMYSSGYLILEEGYITLDLKASRDTINKTKNYYASTSLLLDVTEISLIQEFTLIPRKEGYVLSQNMANFYLKGKNTLRVEELLNYDIKSEIDGNNTGLFNLIGKEIDKTPNPLGVLDLPKKTLLSIASTEPIIIKGEDFKMELTYFSDYKYIP
jgi:hypothetical protein